MQDNIWIAELEKSKIKKWHNFVLKFCKQNKLPQDFYSFLNYEAGGGYVGSTWAYLITANKYYLANSKTFQDYYYTLDKDFRDDILPIDDYRKIQTELRINTKLIQYLRKIQKDDSIL